MSAGGQAESRPAAGHSRNGSSLPHVVISLSRRQEGTISDGGGGGGDGGRGQAQPWTPGSCSRQIPCPSWLRVPQGLRVWGSLGGGDTLILGTLTLETSSLQRPII